MGDNPRLPATDFGSLLPKGHGMSRLATVLVRTQGAICRALKLTAWELCLGLINGAAMILAGLDDLTEADRESKLRCLQDTLAEVYDMERANK